MYIYLDIVILLNLLINTLILLLTAWVLDLAYQKTRLGLAVMITVVYVVISLAWPAPFICHPIGKFFVSLLILWIAFEQKSWNQFFLTLGTFYSISFLLGGAVIGYAFFIQQSDPGKYLAGHAVKFNLMLVGQGVLLGSLLLYFFFKPILRKKIKRRDFYEIELIDQGRKVQLAGLFDSGNQLYGMGNGKPVVLVEYAALQPLFSEEVKRYLSAYRGAEWLDNLDHCKDELWQERITLIAYQAVGSSDFLLGWRIDKIRIKKAVNQWCEFNCIVGIYPGQLSPDGDYQALLHASMREIQEIS